MARFETVWFEAPLGFAFKLVLSSATYSIALYDAAGERLEFSGRQWGPSVTDALAMAGYTGEPLRASSAMHHNFARIDHYRGCPGILDLWKASAPREIPKCAGKFGHVVTIDGETGRDWLDRDRIARAHNAVRLSQHNLQGDAIHIDALPNMETRENLPAGTLQAMIAAGVLECRPNSRGMPGFALAK